MSDLQLPMCTIPSNPDVAGVGIRVAIYSQACLAAFVALFPLRESKSSGSSEKGSDSGSRPDLETGTALSQAASEKFSWVRFVPEISLALEQSLAVTGLSLAISAIVAARSKAGLTDYHALVILNLCILNFWAGVNLLLRRFKVSKSFLEGIVRIFSNFTTFGEFFSAVIPFSTYSVFYSALGFWIWDRPDQFQRYTIDPDTGLRSCQLNTVYWAFVEIPLRTRSRSLKIGFIIFFLFGLSGYRVLAPVMTSLLACLIAFIGVIMGAVYHAIGLAVGAIRHTYPERREVVSASLQRLLKHPWKDLNRFQKQLAPFWESVPVTIYFIVATELLIRSNSPHVSDKDEKEWTFGQFTALFAVFVPLYFQIFDMGKIFRTLADDLDD